MGGGNLLFVYLQPENKQPLKLRALSRKSLRMKYFYSLLFSVLLFMGLSPQAHAQLSDFMEPNIIRFQVVDATTKEPVPDVTATLEVRFGTSTCSSSASSDSLGRVFISNVGRNGLVKIEALGYKPFSRRFVNVGGDTLNLGIYELRPLDILLGTAVVAGKARRFVTKGDTIIYNPDAFNLPEGARLEDLLLKLPGVSRRNGQLFWNNKPLRLMMNGREGLGSNSALMNQLPVEAIDRIKTYDKGDKFEDMTGRKDGEEDQVLDIIVKPGFLDKWSAILTGRAQSRGQYLAEAHLNRLSTHTPVMALLNANNSGTSYEEWTPNGTSFSMAEFGQHLFAGIGANHSWKAKEKKQPYDHRFTFSANMKRTDKEDRTDHSAEAFLPNTNRLFSVGHTAKLPRSVKPDVNMLLEYQVDSMTTLLVSTKVEYDRQRHLNHERFARFEQNPYLLANDPLTAFANATDSEALAAGLLNRSEKFQTNHTDLFASGMYAQLSRRFKDKGYLIFFLSHDYQHNRSTTTENNDYFFYRNGAGYVNEQNILLGGGYSSTWNTGVSYKKWLGKKLLLKERYAYVNKQSNNHSDFYRLNALPGYTSGHTFTPEEMESVRSRSASWHERMLHSGHHFYTKFTYKEGAWRLEADATLKLTHERSNFQQGVVDTVAQRNYATIEPNVSLRYEFDKNNALQGSWGYTTALPTLKNTIDFLDDSNPLTIMRGNSALGRSHQQKAKLTYYAVNAARQRNVSMEISYIKDIHPQAMQTTYNPQTGAYTILPVQVKGGYTAHFTAQWDQGIGTAFQFVAQLSPNIGRDYGWLATTDRGDAPVLNTAKRFGYNSRLRFSYDGPNVRAELEGALQYAHRNNTATINENNRLYEFSFGPSFEWRLPNFQFKGVLQCFGRHGYAMHEMNRLRPYLDLRASWIFLKRKGRIELRWSDVFNRRVYIQGQSTNYGHSASIQHFNIHFFQVAFIYKIDAKGEQKK